MRRWGVPAALAVWGSVLIVICASLLGGHLLTLPVPAPDNPKLTSALAERRAADGWLMTHVLYGDCGCSRRVLRRLEQRGPTALADEHVLLVEPRDEDPKRLRQAGFRVETLERETLYDTFAVAAAPLLVIVQPSGQLNYVGGYTDRKRGPTIEDISLLRESQRGQRPEPRPLFGCAVNTTLARQVDPLGLR